MGSKQEDLMEIQDKINNYLLKHQNPEGVNRVLNTVVICYESMNYEGDQQTLSLGYIQGMGSPAAALGVTTFVQEELQGAFRYVE